MNYCYIPPSPPAVMIARDKAASSFMLQQNLSEVNSNFECKIAANTQSVSKLSLLLDTIPPRNEEPVDIQEENEVAEEEILSSLDYISDLAIEEIRFSEGLRLEAYWDVQQWAIAYGNSYYPDGTPVRQGDRITEQEAEEIFNAVLSAFIDEVRAEVNVPVTKNQLGALVSFAYNLGIDQFRSSRTLRLLNQGDYEGSANAMLAWHRAGNIPGVLTARRNAERELFLTPDL